MSFEYWKDYHFKELEKALTYKDLFSVAELVLKEMPRPIGQVCGPISTGGAGSAEANLKRFDDAIVKLTNEGINIFNQMPFEKPMQKMKKIREKEWNNYDDSLLTDFYLPIFESGLVDTLYFLPDWQSSVGAKWEHEQAGRLGLRIVYLN